jgi:maltose alpha-D-glucosyltransferase/alpha-amylase
MPGSPIIYYGDELGMGDNIFLGDRNSVRTPMQWSPDRNAGFSRADPQSLYLPPIMDPVYGYEAVNVEAQSRDSSSLLNWMRRILAIRRQRKAFGRGRLTFLKPGNRRLLAYLREHDDEVLLCVANLARSAQPVELDLGRFRGRIPVELLGKTAFPPIGDLPYLLTLPAHGFYWFELASAAQAEAPTWHEKHLPPEEPPWLVLFAGLASFDVESVEERRRQLAAGLLAQLQDDVLPRFLPHQRWFAGQGAKAEEVAIAWSRVWRSDRDTWWLALVDTGVGGDRRRFFLPLGVTWEHETVRSTSMAPATLARVRQQARTGLLFDAFADERFARDLLQGLLTGAVVQLEDASLHFMPTRALARLAPDDPAREPIHRPPSEGSSSTLLIGDRMFLKGYRQIRGDINPEWEMGRFLTEVSPCRYVVPVAGAVEYRVTGQEPTTLALFQACVPNQGDAWTYTRSYLSRHLEDPRLQAIAASQAASETHAGYMMLMRTLGARTAGLHQALAVTTGDAAFDPEPLDSRWVAGWVARIGSEATRVLGRLRERLQQLTPACQSLAGPLLAPRRGHSLQDHLKRLTPQRVQAVRTRYHGDYHLGQVLIVENDFVISDLEGEPGGSASQRRMKHTPLKDVAAMLVSFAFARDTIARSALTDERSPEQAARKRLLDDWENCARSAFLDGYRQAIAGCGSYPVEQQQADALLALAGIDRTLYEIDHRLEHRPDRLELPLRYLNDQLSASIEK